MLRLHMPGHNGEAPHDITEIAGADSLYETDSSRGIIAHSEAIAAKLFGAERTCYSAGGSTLAIQAALAILRAQGCKTIAAGRCSHRSLVSSAALLGLEVKWLYPKEYPSADVDCSRRRSPAQTRCSLPTLTTTAAPAARPTREFPWSLTTRTAPT